MSKMIKTAKGFQYSVNITYDLHNAEKIKGFIPTKSSLELLEKILLSTNTQSTDRAHILIGAYGKGKSHIVLAILSVLMRHEPFSDFVHLAEKLKENPRLGQLVKNYYGSNKKLLPVLISGSSTNLTQSFLVALKNTLSENNLSDIMPETNYKAAVNTIEKWQNEYPDVLQKFEKLSEKSSNDFISELNDFNIESYHQFEMLYPKLSAGGSFNPFLGFDVVELYESVAKELRQKGLYDGLYVVYDEFSKYLEANIETASVSDTKMLQDFAEKSCRSGENQLHLLLISHKEISNYIDKLPKQKTDGWRGISERFEHVLLNNNFSQVYEIISTVIQKESASWNKYKKAHEEEFTGLETQYKQHQVFKDINSPAKTDGTIRQLVEETFPLHPISTFILPRLSEQIAQNERTLFTFLSAKGETTLSAFLSVFSDEDFALVTPDLLFDYFEPLFKKEVYSGDIHYIYHLTSVVLEKIGASEDRTVQLERKIVKTLCLIYMLAQFEKLKPVTEEIMRIYASSYQKDEIKTALSNLTEKEYAVYLRQSNSYLKLKETSGVDIELTIHDTIEKQKNLFSLCDVLNNFNHEKYLYPYRYNDEKEMTRFFELRFIDSSMVLTVDNSLNIKKQNNADGIIFALLCTTESERKKARDLLCKQEEQNENKRFLFVLPKKNFAVEDSARKMYALKQLCKDSLKDEILLNEYQVILDDVSDIVEAFIKNYTHPEKKNAVYIHEGKILSVSRQAELTEILSKICDDVYKHSPIINNEAINKNEITSIAFNSRRKILAGLLRSPLEKNLGLIGTGQDVAIMRSTLLQTGIMRQDENSEHAHLVFPHKNDTVHLHSMFSTIGKFTDSASKGKKNFGDLYKKLTFPEYGIGARKGLIPIYIAAVFSGIKNQLVIYSDGKQIPLTSDSLAEINENPERFALLRFELDEDKKEYLSSIQNIFSSEHRVLASMSVDSVKIKMQDWYLSLPKYSREMKSKYVDFIQTLKMDLGAQELLFERLPQCFGSKHADKNLAEKIQQAKFYYDGLLNALNLELADELKKMFGFENEKSAITPIRKWVECLDEETKNHLYKDDSQKLLTILQKPYSNDSDFIDELSLVATGLSLSDWNEKTKIDFIKQIKLWKLSIESFDKSASAMVKQSKTVHERVLKENTYSVFFTDDNGKTEERNFEKVNASSRSKMLYNKLTDSLGTFGRAMTQAEKRQVVMDILQEMCDGVL